MNGIIKGCRKRQSEIHGRDYYILFIKLDNGVNAKTFVDETNKNFERWRPLLNARNIEVANLTLLEDTTIVDADSPVEVVAKQDDQLDLF